MTDLDILGGEATAALTITGTTSSTARRLMQKVLLLLLGPDPGYDLLAKLRGGAPSREQIEQYLQLGRQSVKDSLALEDRLRIQKLVLSVTAYAPPSVSIAIDLETATETLQTTVEV